MESEPSTQIVLPKKFKLSNIVDLIAKMLKKGVAKDKVVHHLGLLLNRGKLVGKALGHVVPQRHFTLNCCSDDIVHCYVSSREYEFSCSSSPIYPTYQPFKKKHHNKRSIQKVFKYLDSDEMIPNVTPGESPIFGPSPLVRQLRVTDSPFSVRDYNEEDTQVDDAAQEFINKFYNDLSQQKLIAALQPPSPYYTWAI